MQRDRANMYLEKITKKDMLIYKNGEINFLKIFLKKDQHERIDNQEATLTNLHSPIQTTTPTTTTSTTTTTTTTTNNSNTGGNLYKTNTPSIEQLKQAKISQIMNRGGNNAEVTGKKGVSEHRPLTNRKPIRFDENGAVRQELNSILSKQKSSKLSKLHSHVSDSKNGMKLEKKAVRFADSLGLELESHIHLGNPSDLSNPYRRRMVRMQPTLATNQYANNLMYQKIPQFAYSTSNGYGAHRQQVQPTETMNMSRGTHLSMAFCLPISR